ncbi:MFS transporter [Streptomyces sp. NBC_00053]|uniref:MFS transporter n=1 Tax=unclassified Streptomyces TaxID=2593676 RepID=UPI00225029DB|nr:MULTISPECIES: MFS transporter [unclassified Streptomyces]MCX5500420.1 MFS transporter [Streptomyces sp. NBC_00052]MCX5551045.1 MFS transporter [Streptomyces sp. NBC_00051]
MTTASEATPRSATSKDSTTDNSSGRVLALVLAAQFMALLDIFIINVAAPTIRSELHASGAGLQLVVAGYTITYAVLLITGARLGDLLGHGRAHLTGLGVFTAASLACGLAAGTGQLIAFRLVQGAAAAVMIPQVLSLIQRHFTGEARIRALGAYSAVLATGAAAGQVLGGVLVSADLFGAGWRPVFLVNVPIGLVLLVLGSRVLPREPRTAPGRVQARARGLDLPGLVLLAAAVTLLTVPLVLGQELDWPVWSEFCMAASVGLFAVFAAYESRLAARGGAPLIAPRVLRVPGMARAALRILLVMAINGGFLFAMTLHVQGGLGCSPLMFAPTALVFGVAGLTWRRWPAGLQGALVPGGFVLVAVASVAVGLLMRGGGDGGPVLYAAFAVMGVGLALGFSPTLTRALADVRPKDAADASGVLVTVTQLGQLTGVAAFGTLYLNRLDAQGVQGSGQALWVCALALSVAAVAGAAAGLVRRR